MCQDGKVIRSNQYWKRSRKTITASCITNKDALESIGSKEAWLNIQSIDSSACINRLMALEGAIQGVRWHDLDSQTKENLKDFYNKHKLK